jgi:threonine/homoserine/homoserine lactone efflux protein
LDGIIVLIVLWFSACSILLVLGTWFRRQERKVRKTRWLRLVLGIGLGVFCITYIAVSIRVQFILLTKPERSWGNMDGS